MAFDSTTFSPATTTVSPVAALFDAAVAPSAELAAVNPDRALAILFVVPQDCDAVDMLTAH